MWQVPSQYVESHIRIGIEALKLVREAGLRLTRAQALNRPAVRANTGIVFTQLVPWTRIARDELLHGRMPLWNRTSASGTRMGFIAAK